MKPNKYNRIKKAFMALFTVIAVIDYVLFKGGSTSLENALGDTMGSHAGQYHLITGILFMTCIVLFPAALAFDVLDKKAAGEPYRKTLIKNILSFVIVLILVLYFYFSGKLFS